MLLLQVVFSVQNLVIGKPTDITLINNSAEEYIYREVVQINIDYVKTDKNNEDKYQLVINFQGISNLNLTLCQSEDYKECPHKAPYFVTQKPKGQLVVDNVNVLFDLQKNLFAHISGSSEANRVVKIQAYAVIPVDLHEVSISFTENTTVHLAVWMCNAQQRLLFDFPIQLKQTQDLIDFSDDNFQDKSESCDILKNDSGLQFISIKCTKNTKFELEKLFKKIEENKSFLVESINFHKCYDLFSFSSSKTKATFFGYQKAPARKQLRISMQSFLNKNKNGEPQTALDQYVSGEGDYFEVVSAVEDSNFFAPWELLTTRQVYYSMVLEIEPLQFGVETQCVQNCYKKSVEVAAPKQYGVKTFFAVESAFKFKISDVIDQNGETAALTDKIYQFKGEYNKFYPDFVIFEENEKQHKVFSEAVFQISADVSFTDTFKDKMPRFYQIEVNNMEVLTLNVPNFNLAEIVFAQSQQRFLAQDEKKQTCKESVCKFVLDLTNKPQFVYFSLNISNNISDLAMIINQDTIDYKLIRMSEKQEFEIQAKQKQVFGVKVPHIKEEFDSVFGSERFESVSFQVVAKTAFPNSYDKIYFRNIDDSFDYGIIGGEDNNLSFNIKIDETTISDSGYLIFKIKSQTDILITFELMSAPVMFLQTQQPQKLQLHQNIDFFVIKKQMVGNMDLQLNIETKGDYEYLICPFAVLLEKYDCGSWVETISGISTINIYADSNEYSTQKVYITFKRTGQTDPLFFDIYSQPIKKSLNTQTHSVSTNQIISLEYNSHRLIYLNVTKIDNNSFICVSFLPLEIEQQKECYNSINNVSFTQFLTEQRLSKVLFYIFANSVVEFQAFTAHQLANDNPNEYLGSSFFSFQRDNKNPFAVVVSVKINQYSEQAQRNFYLSTINIFAAFEKMPSRSDISVFTEPLMEGSQVIYVDDNKTGNYFISVETLNKYTIELYQNDNLHFLQQGQSLKVSKTAVIIAQQVYNPGVITIEHDNIKAVALISWFKLPRDNENFYTNLSNNEKRWVSVQNSFKSNYFIKIIQEGESIVQNAITDLRPHLSSAQIKIHNIKNGHVDIRLEVPYSYEALVYKVYKLADNYSSNTVIGVSHGELIGEHQASSSDSAIIIPLDIVLSDTNVSINVICQYQSRPERAIVLEPRYMNKSIVVDESEIKESEKKPDLTWIFWVVIAILAAVAITIGVLHCLKYRKYTKLQQFETDAPQNNQNTLSGDN